MKARVRPAIVLALVVAVGIGTLVTAREPILKRVGQILVVSEPVMPADIIVVAIDAGGAGVLEAADLVARGVSSRVGVFKDPPDVVDLEFIRRGAPWEDWAARSKAQLAALGIEEVEEIPRVVAGSDEAAQALPEWFAERGISSAILVTTPDHSRRLRRMLTRSMKDHPTVVRVHVTKYASFDPSHWWMTRAGIRTGIVELQKLLLDVVRNPLS